MVGVADDDDMAVLLRGASRKFLNAGNKGASGIHDLCGFLFELSLDLGRYPVGANDSCLSALDLYRFVDSGNAVLAQALHFLVIMNQRAEASNYLAVFEGLFNHLDRSFDAKAKPVFVRQ
jgi:hypothetical protein